MAVEWLRCTDCNHSCMGVAGETRCIRCTAAMPAWSVEIADLGWATVRQGRRPDRVPTREALAKQRFASQLREKEAADEMDGGHHEAAAERTEGEETHGHSVGENECRA